MFINHLKIKKYSKSLPMLQFSQTAGEGEGGRSDTKAEYAVTE